MGRWLGVMVEWMTAAPRTVVWAGHSDAIIFTRINREMFFPLDIVRNLGVLLNKG